MSVFLFYFFSGLALYGAVVMVFHRNMVVCALHLALSMLALAGLFFLLGAHFLATVQVVVYAGAVMVLFVMVMMLFDLKKKDPVRFGKRLWPSLFTVFFLMGLVTGLFPLSLHLLNPLSAEELKITSTKDLSHLLWTEYVLVFEALGVLLLLIAVGVAVLCRSQRSSLSEKG